jgi:hypothetical protein
MPDNAPLGACKFTATGLATNSQTLTLTATVTVKSASKTVLTLSATKVTYGDEQVEKLSVTVSPEFAGPTPTGKVSISESKTTLCVITLSSGKGSRVALSCRQPGELDRDGVRYCDWVPVSIENVGCLGDTDSKVNDRPHFLEGSCQTPRRPVLSAVAVSGDAPPR